VWFSADGTVEDGEAATALTDARGERPPGLKSPGRRRAGMDRGELIDRLDEELRTDDWGELDASSNGLQVGPREGSVDRVAVAVDAAVATAEAAVAADADLLITHHGVIWGGLERLTGRAHDRIAPLLAGDCPLYVSHLPLDGHPELGNAAGLCSFLGATATGPFGELGPERVGRRGAFPDGRDPAAIRERLDDLDQGPADTRHLAFGPETVHSVAVVTGAGGDWLDEAVDAGVDALVTGEGKGRLYHRAREAGIHVYLAGHYATETFGVRALADRCEEWGVATERIDHPTGL